MKHGALCRLYRWTGLWRGAVVGKSQPEVLAFIMEMTEDLDQEIRELAIYMFFVIHRMFQNGYGKKIGKVSSDEIIACYEDNEKLLESLGAPWKILWEGSKGTDVFAALCYQIYCGDPVWGGPGRGPYHSRRRDMGYLFLLMKTVVDVLNKRRMFK